LPEALENKRICLQLKGDAEEFRHEMCGIKMAIEDIGTISRS